MNPEVNDSTPLVAALIYAAKGWPVAPLWWPTDAHRCACPDGPNCKSPAKHPRTRNGLKDASTDEAVIRAWWERWPKANIALVTGIAFDVLDVDINDLIEGIDDLPEIDIYSVPMVITGSSKWHVYFEPTGGGNRAKFSRYCDWRGKGGYVVAPPSVHEAGLKYKWWRDSPETLLPCPDELKMRVLALPGQAPTLTPGARVWDTDLLSDPGPLDMNPENYNFDGLVQRVREAREGERNHVLAWAGYNLWQDRSQGKVPDHKMRQALIDLSAAGAAIGLGEREVITCLRQR